ncbi:MAG: hypothetical protein ABJJ53_04750 [Sulfitobacter sp.]
MTFNPARPSVGTAERPVDRDHSLSENSYRGGDAGRGIWCFKLKRLTKEAGLKTTQKFSPDYSSIVLNDEMGRLGRFDLVQPTVEPAGQVWDGLAERFQELFGWHVPSPDFSTEEIDFDPF